MRLVLFYAALAFGACVPATASSAADWSGEVSLVSDYRYRGISLSGDGPAVQATLDVELKRGAYGELWVSSIKDDGAGRIELDGTAGYALELSEAVSLDMSATYYAYPAHFGSNALELSSALDLAHGPLSGRLGVSLAPPQKGTRNAEGREQANVYIFAGAAYEVAGTPFSFHAQIGNEHGPWDNVDQGSKWDCALGVTANFKRAAVTLDYIGSNGGSDGIIGAIALRF